MKLHNNIELVQINIKQGVDEYYLPKNVNWRERVIDRISLVLSPEGVTLLSPIDGQSVVLGVQDVRGMYIDLYAHDDTQIVRNLAYANLLYTNNHPLEIGEQLSLNLSRLFFTEVPETDGCILLYVEYGSKEVEDEPAIKSVTVTIPLEANGRMSLQDIVDNYILMQPETLKGIYVWDATDHPVYITLRDLDGLRALNDIYGGMCRPPIIYTPGVATGTQLHELRLDNLRIDMLNSFVQNAQNTAVNVQITFNY